MSISCKVVAITCEADSQSNKLSLMHSLSLGRQGRTIIMPRAYVGDSRHEWR
jgi:hypothetical protein